VRCEVTGEWLAESDTVMFQGKRVGAAGKAELLDRLLAGANLGDELEAATIGQRFLGILIDWFVLILVSCLGFVGYLAGFGVPLHSNMSTLSNAIVTIMAVTYFAVMHSMTGQTVGKRIMGSKVVMRHGGEISVQASLIRALAYTGASFLYLLELPFHENAFFLTTISTTVGFIVFGYGIANVVVALTDSAERRSIHDRLSGTRVISVW